MKKLLLLLLIASCGEVEDWLDPQPGLCGFEFNGNVYQSQQWTVEQWQVFVPNRDGVACVVVGNPCTSDWETDFAGMVDCEAVASCMKACSEQGVDCGQC